MNDEVILDPIWGANH